jgi:hypothetical protein
MVSGYAARAISEYRAADADVEQQKRGKALFAEVDALKRLQAETATELDALLPAILDRAFKGEL